MTEKATSLRDTGFEQSNRELQQYYRKGDKLRDNPYLRVHLAQIKKIEADDIGRPTGRATVELLTLPGVRSSVLMPLPSSQYWFVGGLPPINTLVTIGWLPQGLAVILNYYPLGWKQLKDLKELPDLDPGEIFLRAQVRENGEPAPGATLLMDKNGKVTIEDKNKSVKIQMDTDGTVTITGDDIKLGSSGGSLKRLVKETFISLFNSHTHSGVTTGAGISGPPSSPSTSDITTVVEAE